VEFIAAIDAVVSLIEPNPKTGSRPPGIEDSSISRVFVRRFPDHVVYVALPDRIQILAIAHDRRRPAYWAKRLPV
jgi:toxin ParE1/3/4